MIKSVCSLKSKYFKRTTLQASVTIIKSNNLISYRDTFS